MIILLRTIKLSIKSLLLHPMRSILTILGIFIGVSSVIWLLAIGEGIGNQAQKQIAGLGAKNIIIRTIKPTGDKAQGSKYGLTRQDFERIVKTIPTLKKAIPIRILRKELRFQTRKIEGRLVGCSPEYSETSRLKILSGRFINALDMKSERNICAIAFEVADKLFPLGNALGNTLLIGNEYYRIIGVLQKRQASAGIGGSLAAEDYSSDAYIPIRTLWRRSGDTEVIQKPGSFQHEVVELNQITVQVDTQEHVMESAEIIRDTLKPFHLHEDYKITVPLELLEQARTMKLMFILFLGMIAAISLVVGGIGIMNIMLATVTERTREVGIRRALGAKRKDITRQFLIETMVLSIAGGLCGILGGVFCAPIVVACRNLLFRIYPEKMNSLPQVIQEVQPELVGWSIPLAFVISVVVGIVFGVYPAMRAARLDPIEALRHE